MGHKPIEFDYLVDALKSLPGVGYKNATKWAYFLLEQDSSYVDLFINRLKNAHNKIKNCNQCNNLTTKDLCDICTSSNRDTTQVCVVNSIEDLQRIEDSNNYHGLYFVLKEEVNPKQPDANLKCLVSLYNYISNCHGVKEVIIATNFTISGQLMAKKIVDLLTPCAIKIYRIGFGLPLNGAIDYADDETIKYALMNKSYLKG